MTIGSIDVTSAGKQFLREFKEDDLTGMAAELAYHFFLALFPFLLFLTALGGLIASLAGIDNPSQRVLDVFGGALPGDAASVVRTQVEGVVANRNPALLSVSILGTIWAASAGVGSLMKAMNRAYDIPESRPFWKRTALALAATVVGGLAMLVAVLVLVVGEVALSRIADSAGMGSAVELVIRYGRWPVVGMLLLAAISFVYWLLPNTGLPFKWVTPGAIASAILWVVVTIGFAVYVASFASYNATYGTLGGVVVLLLWFYLTSLVILAGAELNAMLDRERSREHLESRRQLVAEQLKARGAQLGVPLKEAEEPAPKQAPVASTALASSLMALAGVLAGVVAWRKFAR